MQPITPITEAAIRPYIGKPVCAVLHDGTYLFGTISECREGQLYFSRSVQGPGTVSTNATRAKKQLRSKMKNIANTSAFTPFFGLGSGTAAFAISLALIAALFFFPFGSPFFF